MMKTWNFEERLQEVVAEYPNLASDRPAALAGREVALGSRAADIMLFDSRGSINIVETKLYRNSDYAMSVNQALQYRSLMVDNAEKTADRLERHFRRTISKQFNGKRNRYLQRRFGLTREKAARFGHELRSMFIEAIRTERVSVTIVADSITPDLVLCAEQARISQERLDIYLVEARPLPNGNTLRRIVNEAASQRRIRWSPPAFVDAEWEVVGTVPLPAKDFRNAPISDRFSSSRGGHRVLLVARGFPEMFLCEHAFARVPSIVRGIHQVDPSRSESCAPLMPCLRRLANDGNPYPDCPTRAPELITDTVYRPFVRISHETWKTMRKKSVLTLSGIGDRTVYDIVARAKVNPNAAPEGDAFRCVIHTLRDLALWGLVRQERRKVHERRFTLLQPGLESPSR